MVALAWISKVNAWIRQMSIFRYFLLSLAEKGTSNYNFVDAYILLFKQEGCKAVATWHQRKDLSRVDMTFYTLILGN